MLAKKESDVLEVLTMMETALKTESNVDLNELRELATARARECQQLKDSLNELQSEHQGLWKTHKRAVEQHHKELEQARLHAQQLECLLQELRSNTNSRRAEDDAAVQEKQAVLRTLIEKYKTTTAALSRERDELKERGIALKHQLTQLQAELQKVTAQLRKCEAEGDANKASLREALAKWRTAEEQWDVERRSLSGTVANLQHVDAMVRERLGALEKRRQEMQQLAASDASARAQMLEQEVMQVTLQRQAAELEWGNEKGAMLATNAQLKATAETNAIELQSLQRKLEAASSTSAAQLAQAAAEWASERLQLADAAACARVQLFAQADRAHFRELLDKLQLSAEASAFFKEFAADPDKLGAQATGEAARRLELAQTERQRYKDAADAYVMQACQLRGQLQQLGFRVEAEKAGEAEGLAFAIQAVKDLAAGRDQLRGMLLQLGFIPTGSNDTEEFALRTVKDLAAGRDQLRGMLLQLGFIPTGSNDTEEFALRTVKDLAAGRETYALQAGQLRCLLQQLGFKPSDKDAEGLAFALQAVKELAASRQAAEQKVAQSEAEVARLASVQAAKMQEQQAEMQAKNSALGADLQMLRDKLAQVEEQKSRLSQQSDGLHAQQADATSRAAALQTQRDELTSQTARLQTELRILQEKAACLQSEKDQLQEQSAALQKQKDDSQAQVASAQKQTDEVAGQRAKLEEELRVQIVTLESQRDQLRRQLAYLQSELDVVQAKAVSLQSEKETLQSDKVTLQKDMGELQSKTSSLQSERDTLQEQVASLQKLLDELQVKVATLQTEKDTLQSKADTLQSEKDDLQAKATALQSDKDLLQEKTASLQSDNDAAKAQSASLQSERDTLQKQKDELQVQASSLQSERDGLQVERSQNGALAEQRAALTVQCEALRQQMEEVRREAMRTAEQQLAAVANLPLDAAAALATEAIQITGREGPEQLRQNLIKAAHIVDVIKSALAEQQYLYIGKLHEVEDLQKSSKQMQQEAGSVRVENEKLKQGNEELKRLCTIADSHEQVYNERLKLLDDLMELARRTVHEKRLEEKPKGVDLHIHHKREQIHQLDEDLRVHKVNCALLTTEIVRLNKELELKTGDLDRLAQFSSRETLGRNLVPAPNVSQTYMSTGLGAMLGELLDDSGGAINTSWLPAVPAWMKESAAKSQNREVAYLQEQLEQVKRWYFNALARAVKLQGSVLGWYCNVDIEELYKEAHDTVPLEKWPVWLTTTIHAKRQDMKV
eukprot:TRINITY_DN638_c0_g1_i2.p1 TRINITY_DN638_c0_g1~~TRINITY_DN638_c0_g1_i2.p1  ORF type:complete len:1303 (-),score=470.43 TRINITY_DN638_c0_g1_i2:85-3807(-)